MLLALLRMRRMIPQFAWRRRATGNRRHAGLNRCASIGACAPSVGDMRHTFVIARTYGAVVEGWNCVDDALAGDIIARPLTVLSWHDLAWFPLLFFSYPKKGKLKMNTLSDVPCMIRLDMVLNSVPIIIFVLDTNAVFTRVEGRGLGRIGLTSNHFVGYCIFEIGGAYPDIIANIRDALVGRTFTTIVEGRGCIFETRYWPLRDDQGGIIGVIGVGFDVTEQTRLSEEVLRLRGQLSQFTLHTYVAPSAGVSVPGSSSVECDEVTLTLREIEILQRVARGMTNKQIAAALHVECSTVKWHLDNVYCKLDVASRTAAVVWAQKKGLL